MKRRVLFASVLVSTVVVSLGLAVPAANADPSYPSWNDVQAAKSNQAASQAEVDTINSLLASLQAAANAAGDLAVKRAAEYSKAEADLQAATEKASALAGQAKAAAGSAASLQQQSGALTEQLARFSGDSLTLRVFLGGQGTDGSPDLLYQLGAVSKLTDRAAALYREANQQKNLAGSLSDQAQAAEATRVMLDADAKKAYAAAQAAEKAVEADLAAQQTHAAVLYAQLATLKNTTAQVEQQYAAGVAAQQAYLQSLANSGAADAVAAPPGMVVDPAGARAYASSQLGNYGWDGGQMGCLINLWNQESGWRADAYNTSSGAYGIPQSLPAHKMSSAGPDWLTNQNTQINWGLTYIRSSYGSPCGAWAHEMSHNWY